MASLALSVDPNGIITTIYSDALADLLDEGQATVTRASHVEPASCGGWIADMSPVDGPTLGPFRLRQEALDAEVEYLKAKLF
jgi:hypothetical protein